MINCFEDGDLSFDAKCILFGINLMFVKYFYCNFLISWDMECSFDFTKCAAAYGLFKFEGVSCCVVHMEGIL